MPAGVYNRTPEHGRNISKALKQKGIRPDPELAKATQFKKGNIPWNDNTATAFQGNGYWLLYDKISKKTKKMHRIVAGRALGRPLKDSEHVHHINGNKLDNRNCNLLICERPYHLWLHKEMSRLYQFEKFGAGVVQSGG